MTPSITSSDFEIGGWSADGITLPGTVDLESRFYVLLLLSSYRCIQITQTVLNAMD